MTYRGSGRRQDLVLCLWPARSFLLGPPGGLQLVQVLHEVLVLGPVGHQGAEPLDVDIRQPLVSRVPRQLGQLGQQT